nr:hypothetical protein [Candidatus Cloacimonadota bacterium]
MRSPENLSNNKHAPREIYPDQQEDVRSNDEKKIHNPRALKRKKDFRPIILCLGFLLFSLGYAYAQIEAELSMGVTFTDNVFQLSDYDLSRWENDHPNLDFVETTDDLNIATKLDLAYPIPYRWWTFTPSITATVNQNISNTDKYRQDVLLRFRVDRYYWSLTTLYGYYPHIYYRHYTDSDGTGELEQYCYERNLYRAELVVRPMRKLTTFANIRYEDLYYNKYFTEADGNRVTTEVGARYSFPIFSLQGSYSYRSYESTGYEDVNADDGSYDSNIYRGVLRMKAMPINGESTKNQSWRPYLELVKEDRFYQGDGDWYGGRVYHIYNTKAGVNVKLTPKWNLSLDYLHIFRNVDSPNDSVIRLKEFSENRLSAMVKYKF